MSEENQNTIDYEYVAKKLEKQLENAEKQIDKLSRELEQAYFDIKKLENDNWKISECLMHYRVICDAYKTIKLGLEEHNKRTVDKYVGDRNDWG